MDGRQRGAREPVAPPRFGGYSALLLVDLQRDFCDPDAGSLPVPGARDLIPLVNALSRAAARAGAVVAASLDWHPRVGAPQPDTMPASASELLYNTS